MVIHTTNHVRKERAGRFSRFGIDPGWVNYIVNETLRDKTLSKKGANYVRLAILDRPVAFEARTKDGMVNGDTIWAVVRWNKQRRGWYITTLLLRREAQYLEGETFWDADELQYVRV